MKSKAYYCTRPQADRPGYVEVMVALYGLDRTLLSVQTLTDIPWISCAPAAYKRAEDICWEKGLDLETCTFRRGLPLNGSAEALSLKYPHLFARGWVSGELIDVAKKVDSLSIKGAGADFLAKELILALECKDWLLPYDQSSLKEDEITLLLCMYDRYRPDISCCYIDLFRNILAQRNEAERE